MIVASALPLAWITLCGEPENPSLLVHNALLLPLADEGRDSFLGYFTVDDDGRILAIDEGRKPDSVEAGEVLNAQGKIVMLDLPFLAPQDNFPDAPFDAV